MGAESFIHPVSKIGKSNVDQAFKYAVADAKYMHGHSGYSGTIGEKDSYVVIDDEIPKNMSAYQYAHHLMDEEDERIDSKWGPAGCIVTDTEYVFFGWASC